MEFTEGAIVRLKFENFLTFASTEIFAGPNLNLITGPNGSGKSTIVCGICLGLAGKTNMLGRAAQLSDYIKHGCGKALIEIELYNPKGPNWVITREIYRDNSSHWSVNRRSASQKVVEQLVANRNIQVGNLCQFLPQDRVADFAKMSQQELLDNTEKAVGQPALFENHCKLKTLGEQLKETEAASRTNEEQLGKERQKNVMLEEDLRNFLECQSYLENIKVLKQKRSWVEYNEARLKYLEIKNHRQELNQQLLNLQRAFRPLQKQLDSTKLAVQQIDTTIKAKNTSIKDISVKVEVKKKQIDDCKEKVLEVLDDLKIKKQDEEQRKQRLHDTKQQLTVLEQERMRLNNCSNVNPQLAQTDLKLEDVKKNLLKVIENRENLNQELQNMLDEKRVTEKKLQKLQDVGPMRLEILSRYDRNAFEAVQWLRMNKQRFRKQIHEPIMTQINVKDPCWAKYLEMHIGRNDMTAFVCEDAQDLMEFLSIVRDERNLKVNAVLVPPEALDSFKAANRLQDFSWCGFHGYLKDLFDAPDGVMRFLCRTYKVHQIPVGSETTYNLLERVVEETPFNVFYTDSYKYSKKRSRYDATVVSTLSTEVRSKRLLVSIDMAQLKESQERLCVQQSTVSKKEAELQALHDCEEGILREQEKLRCEKKRLMSERDMWKNLQVRINQKKESILRLEHEGLDIQEEEKKTKQLIFSITTNKCQLVQKLQSHTQEWMRHLKKKASLALQLAAYLSMQKKDEAAFHEAGIKIQEAQKNVETVIEELREAKAEAHRLMDLAKTTTNMGPNDELSEEMKVRFNRLPNTVEEINLQINEEQAKADCILPADACVVEEYERRRTSIQHLEMEASNRQRNLTHLRQEIDRIKAEWLPELEELISSISRNFGKFFASLGCSGEVSLSKGDNVDEFNKYGICIKVKFRDNEVLKELTPFHQSGGERSVATVLYVMSLQELTRVPFRCVDEINQGMDSENERKVFNLVVSTACRENNSQYFLLTPKLLANLKYVENMMILNLCNGQTQMDNVPFNIEKYCKRQRRINAVREK